MSTKPWPIELYRIAIALTVLSSSGIAWAEHHALIMTLDYKGSSRPLPGIDKDAARARRIALAMGVPERNVRDMRNRELTHAGMGRAIRSLTEQLASGDKVFIYFSGHGTQDPSYGGENKCSEGMLTADERVYLDSQLEKDLDTLAAKASQVVMMNDSCFSGGQVTKDLGDPDLVPKFYSDRPVTAAANASGYQCGIAVNKAARNLEAIGRAKGTNVLFIAAAADNEVASTTQRGSTATLAWDACIDSSTADTDHSGSISGQELRACAQSWINSNNRRQTITLLGNTRLPIYFGENSRPAAQGSANAANTLADIRESSDPSHKVSLNPTSTSLRIRHDELDFSVDTNRRGYLYILQVGSDGKTYNLIFPNQYDDKHYIEVGKHRFPRENWRIRASGPTGASHLLAIVAPQKRNFARFMDTSGAFPSAAANTSNARNLVTEATGAHSGAGRFGASEVVQIREFN